MTAMRLLRFARSMACTALLVVLSLLAPAAEAAIAFRGAAQANIVFRGAGTFASATSGNVIPGIPAGTAAGDLLLCIIESRDNVAHTMPGGWTQLNTGTSGGAHRASIFRKVAIAGEPAPTVTHAAGAGVGAQIIAFTGVDTTTPIEAGNSFTVSGSDRTTEGAGINTSVSHSMLVFTSHAAASYTATTLPAPGTWTQAFLSTFNPAGSANDLFIAAHFGARPATGAQAAVVSTRSSSSNPNAVSHGAQIALRPAAGVTIAVPTLPAATQVNDVMVAAIAVRPSATTITAPAGWTPVQAPVDQSAGNSSRQALYYRVATAADTATGMSYTWTFGAGMTGATGGIASYSGVDTTSPVQTIGSNVTPVGSPPLGSPDDNLTHRANSITTGPNVMLVSAHSFASAEQWTPPGSMNERVDVASEATPAIGGISLEISDVLQAAQGASGDKIATVGGNGDTGVAHLIALRPPFAHYAISGTTGGVTCEPSQVTFTAHDATHALAAPRPGTTLTITTSPSTGVWETTTGTGTWTPGATATYVWPGTEASFTATLRSTSAAASFSVNVTDGSRSEDGTEDPTFSFAASALRVTDSAGVASVAIGTHIAGKSNWPNYPTTPASGFGGQALFLQATNCTSVFQSQTVTVQFAHQCNNPTACITTGGNEFKLRNSGGIMQNIAANDNVPAAPANYTDVTLVFDASSKAPLVFSYPDAGQVTLHARYDIDPGAGVTYISSASQFVVRPFGLRISGPPSGRTGASSTVFTQAGANFNTTVTAVAWKTGDDAVVNGVPDSEAEIASNNPTLNFGKETAAATVTVSRTLAEPAAGNAGTLTGGAFNGPWASGAMTQAMNWNEVGLINLFASSASYLASGQNVTNSAAGLTGVGRFIPASFALSGGALTHRSALPACVGSTFTYMGERLTAAFTLTAKATDGATTTANYDTALGFARLDPTLASPGTALPYVTGLNFGAINGASNLYTQLDLAVATTGSWLGGQAAISKQLTVNRPTTPPPGASAGPYNSFEFGVRPLDLDLVTLQAAAYNLDLDAPGGNDHAKIGLTGGIRFGRLRMENAVGSEKLALPIPIQLQYWNGTGFAINSLDSCTTFARSEIAMTYDTGPLAACDTIVNPNPITFLTGQGTMSLSAPGTGKSGSLTLSANLGAAPPGNSYCPVVGVGGALAAGAANKPYLQGAFTQNANFSENPRAKAAFGLYGSQPNNFIFFRENY